MKRRLKRRLPVHILVFLAPAVLLYTVFMIYPLLGSLRLSLYRPGEGGLEFAGLANYAALLSSPQWAPQLWNALGNNFTFFFIHMLVQNPVGLLLAALLSARALRGRAIYRTLIFTPTVLSVVLVGFIWRLILSPLWGISEDALGTVGLARFNQPWLGQESTALATLSLVSVWQNVGIPMMLFLAALISLPDELLEAARVDGASAWRVFWGVQFPLILPTVGIVTVLTFVGNFNAFDLIYTTQKALAGPNFATDIMGTFFFRTFFGVQLQPGNPTMGAAIAGVMLLVILGGVLVYFVYQRRAPRVEL